MSTAEMNTETSTARALIEARLEAVEQALIGRITRAERLDIVGEVESRIDELLHERCGPGTEPTRADVLAVLMKIDPPEAYLAFESGDEPRPALAAGTARSPRFETGVIDRIDRNRTSKNAVLYGVIGIFAAMALPGILMIGQATDSALICYLGVAACAFVCMFAGVAAIVLAFAGRSMTARSVGGAILGTISVLMSLAMVNLLIDA